MSFFGSFKPNPNSIDNVTEDDLLLRLGLTRDSLKISRSEFPEYSAAGSPSVSHEYCWWTLDTNVTDTSFAYSDVHSYVGGTIFTLQSIAGTILNFLFIVALLRNRKLREEYLTWTILSISITDFIWSVFVLPVNAVHFFTR